MVVIAEESEKSPLITLDGDVLSISGRSYMNDAVDYYRRILNIITDIQTVSLQVVVAMEYFNTSSSKCLLELFKLVRKKAEAGQKASIVWKYSSKSPEMQETGEDYRDLLGGIPFDIVQED
ncbi:MAG: DUF1987 domain-containing protein [Bacteroidales bacterium]|nr:DUF1987 domain-containing protein [Bacteroidales bacterium]